jgi:hypothetical protein
LIIALIIKQNEAIKKGREEYEHGEVLQKTTEKVQSAMGAKEGGKILKEIFDFDMSKPNSRHSWSHWYNQEWTWDATSLKVEPWLLKHFDNDWEMMNNKCKLGMVDSELCWHTSSQWHPGVWRDIVTKQLNFTNKLIEFFNSEPFKNSKMKKQILTKYINLGKSRKFPPDGRVRENPNKDTQSQIKYVLDNANLEAELKDELETELYK